MIKAVKRYLEATTKKTASLKHRIVTFIST